MNDASDAGDARANKRRRTLQPVAANIDLGSI